MTLKTTVIGAVLAAATIGAVNQARAEAVRVDVAPARVEYVQRARVPYVQPARVQHGAPRVRYVQPVRRSGWARYHGDARPTVAVPVPTYGYRTGYIAPNPRGPELVATQIRAEMDQATDDVRFDVRQGVVEPRALALLEADRDEIERDLAAAAAKGYITPEDREHLEQHVQEIRDLRTQLRCAEVRNPFGLPISHDTQVAAWR